MVFEDQEGKLEEDVIWLIWEWSVCYVWGHKQILLKFFWNHFKLKIFPSHNENSWTIFLYPKPSSINRVSLVLLFFLQYFK